MEIQPGLRQYVSYYFIENVNKKLTAVIFTAINKQDRDFERQFVKMIYNHAIPATIYDQVNADTINFAGRKIALGGSCHWMDANNLQCPHYGQMNWSVHQTIDDARQSVQVQFARVQMRKGIKMVTDDTATVIFESREVQARRVTYLFKQAAASLLLNRDQRTLTVYFIAAPVRGNFVSCVLSYWNSDAISDSGLPPLLAAVMQLQ